MKMYRNSAQQKETYQSLNECHKQNSLYSIVYVELPMMQMGLRMKRRRPQNPIYFDLQPADHNLTKYSAPKKTTKHISCNKKDTLIFI